MSAGLRHIRKGLFCIRMHLSLYRFSTSRHGSYLRLNSSPTSGVFAEYVDLDTPWPGPSAAAPESKLPSVIALAATLMVGKKVPFLVNSSGVAL
jgi:hypothetical protein